MKVLVIGSGAREHALVVALLADPQVETVEVAPGNAGVAQVAPTHALDPTDGEAVADLAARLRPDLVVIGPEAPLVAGVADAVRERGIDCFGPSAAAAQLEGSKAFAHEVMAAAGVPTSRSRACTDLDEVREALALYGAPHVVKEDGLAAGKGVVVTGDEAVALAHAQACLDRAPRVVVEEFLDGPEVSVFCICDGADVVALEPAQDFKRVGDGDEGPNTGGMGAYSPLPWAPPDLAAEVVEHIARPVVAEMARRGTPFAGVLYVGLALTSDGPKVVEFNVRFGDPETQVVLPRLATPLGGLLRAAATGALGAQPPLQWRPEAAVTVVLAAGGYPSAPRTGDPISGVAAASAYPGASVLHAGTRLDGQRLVSSGGRVLSVVGVGAGVAEARESAYAALALITLPHGHYRGDIARAAARLTRV